MPVEALLLPLRMPLFCSFEIIALVGCGIDDGRLSTESAVQICRGEILPEMETLREISDGAELIMDRAAWPYPSYGEILTSVY